LRLVQIRERNLEPAARHSFAEQVIRAVSDVGGIVVINGDPGLATILGAGVHWQSRELMTAHARPDAEWCGASCHDAAELDKARELGLDFVLLGPVQVTPSHPDSLELGWQKFAELIQDYPLPVFALGGMRRADLEDARRRAAHGVAMVRGAWQPEI
jgi:8-oxo-dGTP diphosphatase